MYPTPPDSPDGLSDTEGEKEAARTAGVGTDRERVGERGTLKG